MGIVYRVRHRGWNLDLAVKCPRETSFQTEEQKESFVREAEVWMDLGLHPNVVTCHYVRRLGGIPRIFVEFVPGGSLDDWIRDGRLYEGGPEVALGRVLDFAVQIAWGLDYAHKDFPQKRGLVHQDVKPSNVLVAEDGTIKLTDFGLARARAATTELPPNGSQRMFLVTGRCGTPAFQSKEQIEAKEVSRRTDIWSWGLSVLVMYLGRIPWGANSLAAPSWLKQVRNRTTQARLTDMPAALADLLDECLQFEPERRPISMREVADRLRGIYRATIKENYPRQVPNAEDLLTDSLNNRAVSLLDLGKQEEAEEAWERGLQADPVHLETTYNWGLIRWRAARLTDKTLLDQLHTMCASHPGQGIGEYLQVLVHLERGDCEAALGVLSKTKRRRVSRVEWGKVQSLAESRLPQSNRCLHTFEGHSREVTSVALSSDGRYALSGSGDRTLRLWQLDWVLKCNRPADWDEGARPYLETFLVAHRRPSAYRCPER
jgi:serine/threonine protein kinase